MNKTKHISVCICTHNRSHLLKLLLQKLACQDTDDRFTYSIVVVENGDVPTAGEVVGEFAAASAIQVTYCTQPVRSIALTRNEAVKRATGDFVAFIDDDEYPAKDWLLQLFRTCEEYGADAVLGPVKPYFDREAPRWVVEGGLYDRPMHQTGVALDWSQCRTGNVLLKAHLVQDGEPFDPAFRVGSDIEFFRKKHIGGHSFVWCNEAVVHELVPPSRWKRTYLIKKALIRGASSRRHYSVHRSLIATPAYALALPVALVLGQGKFMMCAFRFSYHLGRLLALFGIDPIQEPYVPEEPTRVES